MGAADHAFCAGDVERILLPGHVDFSACVFFEQQRGGARDYGRRSAHHHSACERSCGAIYRRSAGGSVTPERAVCVMFYDKRAVARHSRDVGKPLRGGRGGTVRVPVLRQSARRKRAGDGIIKQLVSRQGLRDIFLHEFRYGQLFRDSLRLGRRTLRSRCHFPVSRRSARRHGIDGLGPGGGNEPHQEKLENI